MSERATDGSNPERVRSRSMWLDTCGDDLTRANLLEELKGIHEWDGGGLHFLADPGANKSSNCFMYMEVKGGKFVRLWPEEATTFDCDDSYRYDLGEDFGGGATVQSN